MGEDALSAAAADRQVRRAAEFARMRKLAGALLVLMFVLFIAARGYEETFGWLSFVRAFAEAAMVGAIADWFAVTALFRRPFGLPIPHTAIVPRNKDRIGDALGNFVAGNFLTPDVLLPRLKGMETARRLADWLAEPAHSRQVAARLSGAVRPVIEAIDDDRVRAFLRDVVARRVEKFEAAPLLGRVLAILVAGRRHQELFDRALDAAAGFLADNREVIRGKIADKSSWWVPDWAEEKLFVKIMAGVEETLNEMRAPDHRWRDEFDAAVARFIHDLAHSPEQRRRVEALKAEVLGHPAVHAYLDSLAGDVKRRLIEDAGKSGGRVEQALEWLLVSFGRQLQADARMQAVIDGWVERAVLRQVVPRRSQIGAFIAGVVRKWEARTVVEKLELQFGKDLQYIRINGTLVGGLVGLAIHGATALLGG